VARPAACLTTRASYPGYRASITLFVLGRRRLVRVEVASAASLSDSACRAELSCNAEMADAEAVIPGDGKMIHPDGSAKRPGGGHYAEQFCRSICYAALAELRKYLLLEEIT
jgi:hypothetical protein